MPIFRGTLVPNEEERQAVEGLVLAWNLYMQVSKDFDRVMRKATNVIFPMSGANERREVLVSVHGKPYRLHKNGRITKVEPL